MWAGRELFFYSKIGFECEFLKVTKIFKTAPLKGILSNSIEMKKFSEQFCCFMEESLA